MSRPTLSLTGTIKSEADLRDQYKDSSNLSAAWPEVFGPTPSGSTNRHPRRALADWLADPRHPLSARVWVNLPGTGYVAHTGYRANSASRIRGETLCSCPR